MGSSNKPFSWADFEASIRADNEVPSGARTLQQISQAAGLNRRTMGDRLAALARQGQVFTKLALVNGVRQRVYWFKDAEISGNAGDTSRVRVRRGSRDAVAGAKARGKAGRKA